MAAEVVALDPEPEMLRVAREASAGFANITWHLAGSGELSPRFGRFRLVCMGRSFHWMDRAETLRRLEAIIEPEGAVALFHDEHPDVADNAWYSGYREILQRYRGADAPRHRAPGWTRHEGVLLESAFCRLEEISVFERRAAAVEGLIARALSMSSNSQAKLGERTEAMVAELRASLPAEGVREVIASIAMLAWRPVGGDGRVNA